jgi:hypothetical protein
VVFSLKYWVAAVLSPDRILFAFLETHGENCVDEDFSRCRRCRFGRAIHAQDEFVDLRAETYFSHSALEKMQIFWHTNLDGFVAEVAVRLADDLYCIF